MGVTFFVPLAVQEEGVDTVPLSGGTGMKNKLSTIRDLLGYWNRIGRRIVTGEIVGVQVTLLDSRGDISVHLGGTCEEDPALARRVALMTAYKLTPDSPSTARPARPIHLARSTGP
jgi:hypothetical protein